MSMFGGQPANPFGGMIPQLPGMGEGQERMARALFSAILAAGKNSCNCQVCQLMRQVADAMVESMLKEGEGGTRQDSSGA